MITFSNLLIFLALVVVAIRLLRWLGFVQEKEYRLDRLWLMIRTRAGLYELLRVFPRRSDFSKSGLKRPRFTPRLLAVAITWLILAVLGILYLENYIPGHWRENLLILILIETSYVLLITPFLVILAILPSLIIANLRTRQELRKAQQLFAAKHPLIIGVTGSYGKSSTKHLLAHLLALKYTVFYTPKSFNTRYSVAHSIVEGYTDESVAILEYAAYTANEISQLTKWFIPKIAIVTGIVEQHLGLFSSLEKIIKAKSELVSAVAGGGSVFYNDSDPLVKQVVDLGMEKLQMANGDSVGVFAVGEQDLVRAWREPKLNERGRLEFMWGNKKVMTRLVGLHYFNTLKIVTVVAAKLDVSDDDILKAIETFVPNELFIQSFTLRNEAVLIDDGRSSNPKGFEAMVELAAKTKGSKRKTLIFSGIVDLGAKEQDIHRKLAKLAKKHFDRVFWVGTAGKAAFDQVFELNMIEDHDIIKMELNLLRSDDLIVLEGRMPGWITSNLNRMKT